MSHFDDYWRHDAYDEESRHYRSHTINIDAPSHYFYLF